MSESASTEYGFVFGPMIVERVAHDERLGWVVTIRPVGAYVPSVTVRCSPKGRNWNVSTRGDVWVDE